MPLLLTRKDVESVLTMEAAMAAVEEGFRRLAQGGVNMPPRVAIRLTDHQGLHLSMPASISGGESEALAVKVVTVYPENPGRYGLPTTIGTLLLNDPRSGALLAVMEAGFLTAMRTGAASGVATRYLAREDARTAGIYGAGVQARTQLMALCEARPITSAMVCDPDQNARERFAAEMSTALRVPVQPTSDARACAQNDILVTASSSRTPVLLGQWIRPGTHINGIGSHSPDARELDTETVRRSRIIADHIPARLAEDGDFILPIREGAITQEHIAITLGEVIAGTKPGRTSEHEVTLFKSGGLAVQDAATAAKVYQLALAAGVGREFEI